MPAENDDIAQADQEIRVFLLERFDFDRNISRNGKRRLYFKRLAWIVVTRGAYVSKRGFDIVVSTILILLLLPFFLLLAIVIRIESPGRVLFHQTRVGRWGTLFTMWKFRSMFMDAEERKKELMAQNDMQDGVLFKMRNDPRITRIGRIIRKTSIDELPQLWNVLKGDMSLVGPRPPVPSEVELYSLSDRRRLDVIPGITCIWQISGRSTIPFDQQVELDAAYIHSQSFWTDLKILLKTIPALLFGKGAY